MHWKCDILLLLLLFEKSKIMRITNRLSFAIHLFPLILVRSNNENNQEYDESKKIEYSIYGSYLYELHCIRKCETMFIDIQHHQHDHDHLFRFYRE